MFYVYQLCIIQSRLERINNNYELKNMLKEPIVTKDLCTSPGIRLH